MVLSDTLRGNRPASLFQRTLLYIFGFGIGSLAVAGLLSFVFVSAAEGLLPAGSGQDELAAGTQVEVIGGPSSKSPDGARSKAAATRVRQGAKTPRLKKR